MPVTPELRRASYSTPHTLRGQAQLADGFEHQLHADDSQISISNQFAPLVSVPSCLLGTSSPASHGPHNLNEPKRAHIFIP